MSGVPEHRRAAVFVDHQAVGDIGGAAARDSSSTADKIREMIFFIIASYHGVIPYNLLAFSVVMFISS